MPCSTIWPSSSTRIRSASTIVESRCAITSAVRPASASASARWIAQLGLGVEVRRGFVEDHDRRVLQQHACDREPLLLAARQPVAALAHDRVVPVGKRRDQVVDPRRAARLHELVVGRVGPGVAQVGADAVVEQVGVLHHHADGARSDCEREVADVVAVDAHAALHDVVDARDEQRGGGLARARRSHERDELAGRDVEADVAQDPLARLRRRVDRRAPSSSDGDRRRPRPADGGTTRGRT